MEGPHFAKQITSLQWSFLVSVDFRILDWSDHLKAKLFLNKVPTLLPPLVIDLLVIAQAHAYQAKKKW